VRSSIAPGTGSADEGEFLLVEAGERELDGAPALSLTFTLPLDVRQSYDQHIRVFQMPAPPQRPEDRRFGFEVEDRPGTGGTVVSTKPEDTSVEGGTVVGGAWIVGENPRLLHFPHIKPETRYVVLVNPGLPARKKTAPAVTMMYMIFGVHRFTELWGSTNSTISATSLKAFISDVSRPSGSPIAEASHTFLLKISVN